MGYLTALARTDLDGHLDHNDRNIVEKLFQTYTLRISRFHETGNGGQHSAERWLDSPGQNEGKRSIRIVTVWSHFSVRFRSL